MIQKKYNATYKMQRCICSKISFLVKRQNGCQAAQPEAFFFYKNINRPCLSAFSFLLFLLTVIFVTTEPGNNT